MKIKVKIKFGNIPKYLQQIQIQNIKKWNKSTKGDWNDLIATETINYNIPTCISSKEDPQTSTVKFHTGILSLGIAMKLPKGFEAVVVPRSSLWRKKGIIQANSFGVIDNSYNGNSDIWGFPFVAFNGGFIQAGERICQFKIQPSQKANFWTKIKWLFCSGFKFEMVDSLNSTSRGGFGSTGGYSEI